MLSTYETKRKLMKKNEFEKLLSKAEKAESRLSSLCGDLAIMFQPYFEEEVDVIRQADDGFVIVYEMHNSNSAPENEPCEAAFNNILADKNHYK